MHTPQTLTRTEGTDLTDTHQAARLSEDFLVTRHASYRWNETIARWEVEQDNVLISKCSGSAGTFIWQRGTQQFVRKERT